MSRSVKEWMDMLAEAAREARRAVSGLEGTDKKAVALGIGASGDVTLLADRKAEDAVLKVLLRSEGLRVLSEEAGSVGDPGCLDTAVVDPLDGSSNFSKGLPFYCCSVAVATGPALKDVAAATVVNLVNGDTYCAARGEGASKNGSKISASKETKLSKAALGVDMSRVSRQEAASLAGLISSAKRVVHYGANALELCLLAEGKLDGFVDLRGRMRVTDIAGGYLIAKEAGAKIAIAMEPPTAPVISLEGRFNVVASGSKSLQARVLEAIRPKGRAPKGWALKPA